MVAGKDSYFITFLILSQANITPDINMNKRNNTFQGRTCKYCLPLERGLNIFPKRKGKEVLTEKVKKIYN